MPKYLSKETKGALSGERVSEYPLPYDSEILVRVKSLPIGRLNRYSEATAKGGERAKLETYHLIADSIIDEVGGRVWETSEVKELASADCRLIKALIGMIGKHNGGSDTDVEEMEKNFDATE